MNDSNNDDVFAQVGAGGRKDEAAICTNFAPSPERIASKSRYDDLYSPRQVLAEIRIFLPSYISCR